MEFSLLLASFFYNEVFWFFGGRYRFFGLGVVFVLEVRGFFGAFYLGMFLFVGVGLGFFVFLVCVWLSG